VASLPWEGSVRPNAKSVLPASRSWMNFCFCSGQGFSWVGVRGEGYVMGFTRCSEFSYHQDVGEVAYDAPFVL
jgi:hypothetical protein